MNSSTQVIYYSRLNVKCEGVPEAEQRCISDVKSIIPAAASRPCRAVPLGRYLLVQELAIHIHLAKRKTVWRRAAEGSIVDKVLLNHTISKWNVSHDCHIAKKSMRID